MALTSASRQMVAVIIALYVLTVIAFALRIGARLRQQVQRKRPWARSDIVVSDVLMAIALTVFTVDTALELAAVNNPTGSVELTELVYHPEFANSKVILLTVGAVLNPAIIASSKLSILFFYRAIFVSSRFRLAVWIATAYVVSWFICFTLITAIRCLPVSASWNLYQQVEDPNVKCVEYGSLIFSLEITNIFADLLILALPIHQLTKLQMRLAKKFGIGLLFILGFLVAITSAIRISFTYGYVQVPTTRTIIWTTVQLSVGIIGGCLPTMLPVIPEWLGRGFNMLSERVQLLVSRVSSARSPQRRDSPPYSGVTPPHHSGGELSHPWELKKKGVTSETVIESGEHSASGSAAGVPEDAIAMHKIINVSRSP